MHTKEEWKIWGNREVKVVMSDAKVLELLVRVIEAKDELKGLSEKLAIQSYNENDASFAMRPYYMDFHYTSSHIIITCKSRTSCFCLPTIEPEKQTYDLFSIEVGLTESRIN